jgi:hypothetical protein
MRKTLSFIGIGAEKAGTTWLARCLSEHPEIFVPKEKELFFFNEFDPHYFKIPNLKYERGIGWYERKFERAKEPIKGEFSPTYLYGEAAARRIKKHFPDAKLIVVLRDPVRRAFSQYVFDKSLGVIADVSFERALRGHAAYLEKGDYAKYLEIYYSHFRRNQILVLFNEDLRERPEWVVRKLYRFVGARDIGFRPSCLYKTVYAASQARYPMVNAFLVRVQVLLARSRFQIILRMIERLGLRDLAVYIKERNVRPLEAYPVMARETERRLRRYFRPRIRRLESLLGVDLGRWRRMADEA